MTDEHWFYKISKKYWGNREELSVDIAEEVKDVKGVAHLLKDFLEKEKIPFNVLGEIEIMYSDKSADENLNEHWGKAFLIVPVLKRGFLKSPRYDKLEEKHYIKIRVSLNKAKLDTWQEHKWDSGSIHRWYLEMEQIKAWKELLDKFGKTLASLKSPSEITNPSAR